MAEKLKIVERLIAELIPADYNPRNLSEKQFEDIKKSLTKFGFVDPVLINIHKTRKDIIIGGHQRTKVWKSMGNDSVPCVELTLTLKKEKELNIRLNKNTGSFDFDMLANHYDIEELLEYGFEEFELDTIEEPEDLTEDEAKEIKPSIKITFGSFEEVERAKIDIQDLLNQKYPDAIFNLGGV